MEKRNLTRPLQMIFRVSEHEKELIRKKMELAKTKKQSAYLRKMAIDGAIFHIDYSQLREICGELGKIGANINQIAKRVNTSSRIYDEDIAEIKKKQAEIFELVNSMKGKLL